MEYQCLHSSTRRERCTRTIIIHETSVRFYLRTLGLRLTTRLLLQAWSTFPTRSFCPWSPRSVQKGHRRCVTAERLVVGQKTWKVNRIGVQNVLLTVRLTRMRMPLEAQWATRSLGHFSERRLKCSNKESESEGYLSAQLGH